MGMGLFACSFLTPFCVPLCVYVWDVWATAWANQVEDIENEVGREQARLAASPGIENLNRAKTTAFQSINDTQTSVKDMERALQGAQRDSSAVHQQQTNASKSEAEGPLKGTKYALSLYGHITNLKWDYGVEPQRVKVRATSAPASCDALSLSHPRMSPTERHTETTEPCVWVCGCVRVSIACVFVCVLSVLSLRSLRKRGSSVYVCVCVYACDCVCVCVSEFV